MKSADVFLFYAESLQVPSFASTQHEPVKDCAEQKQSDLEWQGVNNKSGEQPWS